MENKFVCVRLEGGLGNQMFQYAAGLALARRHGIALVLDLTFLRHRLPKRGYVFREFQLDSFSAVECKFTQMSDFAKYAPNSAYLLSRFVRRLQFMSSPASFHRESCGSFRFDPWFLSAPKGCYIEGYFQNLRYFTSIAPEVRDLFAGLREPVSSFYDKAFKEVADNPSAVAVNFRRTDYLLLRAGKSGPVILDENYYSKAVGLISRNLVSPRYYIFSDDIRWCEENVRLGRNQCFVERCPSDSRYLGYMKLMSSFRNIVIPNSTFAWWCAWLGSPLKSVVAPRFWLHGCSGDASGLLPPSWRVVD